MHAHTKKHVYGKRYLNREDGNGVGIVTVLKHIEGLTTFYINVKQPSRKVK